MDLSNINWSQCANSGLNGLKDFIGGRFNKTAALTDKCYGNAPGALVIASVAVVVFAAITVNQCVKIRARRQMQVLNNQFAGMPFNQTNLLNACKNGHMRYVKACLDMGLTANEQDDQLNTPLTKACEGKQWGIALFLLEKGANPSQVAGQNAETPLHHAAKAGKIQVVQALLEKEANLNLTDGNGRSVLHAACIPSENLQENIHRLDIIKLLQKKGLNLDVVDHLQRTPIHEAAKGNAAFLKALLSKIEKKESVSLKDHEGKTALHEAAAANQPENVTVLLAHKANINEVDAKKNTPLHLAGADAARELLANQKVKANLFNTEGHTPLMSAMLRGDTKAVVAMLESKKVKPEVQLTKGKSAGMTLAHVAVALKPLNRKAGLEVLKVLIEKYPKCLNAPNNKGQSPLHVAFEHYNVGAYKLLLGCKTVSTNAADKEDLTPMDYAVIHGAIVEGLNVLPLFAKRKVVFTMDDKKRTLLIKKLKEKFRTEITPITKIINLTDLKKLQADIKAKKESKLVQHLENALGNLLDSMVRLSKNMLDPQFQKTGKFFDKIIFLMMRYRSFMEVAPYAEYVKKEFYANLEKFHSENPVVALKIPDVAMIIFKRGFKTLQDSVDFGLIMAAKESIDDDSMHQELLREREIRRRDQHVGFGHHHGHQH